ncbi:deacetoxyvindoline 4-hydroxylase-like [Syzygium oleosum]|uniref:deacetoxyvindoline 4-hydroxylase-like n=1 Tax=Syzygium oleosum TaxID=219896 RepID=UPI0024BA7FB9|nr:deacetoxyvindoline 4-hydroxylase-like [Syzygium oleosum]
MQTLLSHGESFTCSGPHYDRVKELQEFDKTKAGVKGLVDSGVTKIPRIFVHPPENLHGLSSDANRTGLQIINHGIPLDVIDNMLDGVKKFHEQQVEVKKELYSRDRTKRVRYFCWGNLFLM